MIAIKPKFYCIIVHQTILKYVLTYWALTEVEDVELHKQVLY